MTSRWITANADGACRCTECYSKAVHDNVNVGSHSIPQQTGFVAVDCSLVGRRDRDRGQNQRTLSLFDLYVQP